MAQASIILEFTTKGAEQMNAKLVEASDKLNKMEVVAKDAFKELEKGIKEGASATQVFNTSIEASKKQLASLDPASKAYKKLEKEIKAAEIATNAMGESEEKLKTKLRAVIGEIGTISQRLDKMREAGLQGTSAFKVLQDQMNALEKEGGQLKDAIGDISSRVSALGSDTQAFDALLGGAQGIVGAFQIAEGAAALFGEESADLQKTLVQLNAVQSIAMGLQQTAALLLDENATKTFVLSNATKAYNIVVGTSTGLMKGLRIAMAATGIGLLVVGLVALVTNFDKVKQKVQELFPSLGNLDEKINNLKQNIVGFGMAAASVFENLLKGKFSKIGEDMEKAFAEGKAKERKNQIDKANKEAVALEIDSLERRKKVLEAGGKDTYNIEKSILDKKISLEKQGTKEYLDLLADREALIAARKKEIADKSKEDAIVAVGSIQFLQDQISKLEEQINKTAPDSPILVSYIEKLKEANRELEIAKEKISKLSADKPIKVPEIPLKLKPTISKEEFQKGLDDARARQKKEEEEVAKEERESETARIEAYQKQANERINIANQIGTSLKTISDGVFSAELTNIENRKRKELEAIDASGKSKQEKDKLKAESERKYAAEVATVRREQAIADKASALFSIAINTASAIAATIGKTGFFGTPLAAIVGALGAAQAAVVLATPIPQFGKGGKAVRDGKMIGKRHSNGGIDINVEGGEYVINRKAVQTYGDSFFEAINKGSLPNMITHKMDVESMSRAIEKSIVNNVKVDMDGFRDEIGGLRSELAFLGQYMKGNTSATMEGNGYLSQIARTKFKSAA